MDPNQLWRVVLDKFGTDNMGWITAQGRGLVGSSVWREIEWLGKISGPHRLLYWDEGAKIPSLEIYGVGRCH